MQTVKPLNTIPLEQFIDKVKIAENSKQIEVKIEIKEAKNLALTLGGVMSRLHGDLEKLVDQAMEFGWSVAFPEWDNKVEDVADAVLKYGRLFTIQSILKTTESSKLKIDLKRKMYG